MKHKIQIPCTIQPADNSGPAEDHTLDLEVEAANAEEAYRIASKAAHKLAFIETDADLEAFTAGLDAAYVDIFEAVKSLGWSEQELHERLKLLSRTPEVAS